ncbi:GNAT family N-acetyltransferase [Chitinibacter sp. SCUT-21]|uniref:GNAT family N-acetyltransferase n=1 Tax=Chitinibacter sp. SCUT-21 TaxID=2970891 RepID=UPI0035A6146D
MAQSLSSESLDSANALSAPEWQSLNTGDDPFLSRAFLGLAETTRAASPRLGWQAAHLALRDHTQQLQGFMPMYLRSHSFGDFSRDWQWDQAWQSAGLAYYPKLVTGIPFTPSPGPRAVLSANSTISRSQLIQGALQVARDMEVSSWQCLFVTEEDRTALLDAGVLLRQGVQFHWINRGYESFDDYLATFTADKRKKLKRERRQVSESGLSLAVWHGDEIAPQHWSALYRQYANTFRRYGNHPAFSQTFFEQIARELGQRMVIFVALQNEQPIASAICYRNANTLFGRHWGADLDCPGLHFELCYYQGIHYAIEYGLQRFEPGAQGEHKLARGFEPINTWCGYWIANPTMRHSVAQFLAREHLANEQYQQAMRSHLPFKVLPEL